jgi:hypothetical protein
MEKRSRILIFSLGLMGLVLFLFTTCKKTSNDNNTGWNEEDKIFYDNVIALQEQAAENYDTWLLTMDSLEVINQLQQFFLGDPSVTSATIGSQGIAVQYSNGMRGGIFLNPEDDFEVDTTHLGILPKTFSSDLNEKSLVNNKKAIFLNPSYWERSGEANSIIASYNVNLPKAGFSLQTVYKNEEASVDRFTELSGYGIIHIYSHGWAWPENTAIEDVYLKTGEVENDVTTEKYALRMLTGDIIVAERQAGYDDQGIIIWKNIYFIDEEFVASQNDFSKDTVLFYGGFCYSFLGKWPEIEKIFAKGAYFGFDWSVFTSKNVNWAKLLIYNLTDTTRFLPCNPPTWMNMPNPPKSYFNNKDNKTVNIKYVGDATLTLWKDSAEVETSPITNITQTTATGGGNIKSDGGFAITARGICWGTSAKPTIAGSHTTDGSGTGVFVSNLTGLTPNTPYYVRAYAANSQGTIYGNEVSFTALSGDFYIGQSYGGGIIFYIDGTGKHGLICAPTDQGPGSPWGCDTTLIGTSAAIGTGQANTTAIINGCGEAGIAARVCDDLVLNGYSDWYMPSIDELYQLYLQRNIINVVASHWTSTEYNKNFGVILSFTDGEIGDTHKSNPNFVRAIRAF